MGRKKICEKNDSERKREPFKCDESRAFALAGQIIASGAQTYRLCGCFIKRIKRKCEIGYTLDKKRENERIAVCESAMIREKAFILSDRFQILLGQSRMDGEAVIQKLDEQIAAYDPTYDVPDINPMTGKPYSKKKWERLMREAYGQAL